MIGHFLFKKYWYLLSIYYSTGIW